MSTNYLPHFLAAIGICLAIYAWQRSVRLTHSVRNEREAHAIRLNHLSDRPLEKELEAQRQPKSKCNSSRGRFLRIIFVAASALILIASFYLDDSVARLIHDHADSRLTNAGRLVSHYGDWPEHAALGVILWVVAYFLKSQRWKRVVLMMILASVLGGLTADVIRSATGRPRPSAHVADGWYGPHLNYKYNSFPSGHAAASTTFFGVLLFVEWPIGALVLIFPIAVGVARLVVGAHHFSDIVGSAIIEVVAAYAAIRIFRPRSPTTACLHP